MTPMLTVSDCAKRIGCNEATVRVWIKEGKLPAANFGGHLFRIDPEDLEAFIASRKQPEVNLFRDALASLKELVALYSGTRDLIGPSVAAKLARAEAVIEKANHD